MSTLRVLAVEDNDNMRRMLRLLLHSYGIREILEAANGREGLQLVLDKHPDIVITDWEMPDMDGLEMTRQIRAHESDAVRFTPVLVLTAHAERGRVTQARDAGIHEFLCKPIAAKTLYLRLLNMVTNGRPFIKTKTFFGPDRRRFVYPEYAGSERRSQGAGSENGGGEPPTENGVHPMAQTG